MARLMKSVSGIRGIVGKSLTTSLVLNFARRFGFFCNNGKIVVGRDSRTTGEMFLSAINAGLRAVGSDIVDLGICPTPTILLFVQKSDVAGGIAITASHNPPEWNALKLINNTGTFLTQRQAEDFWSIREDTIIDKDWQNIGILRSDKSAIDNHINAILKLKYVKLKSLQKKKYKVVIDSTNGAGGLLSPKLLKKLGCQVIEIYSEPTGRFSRVAEPAAENLSELERVVVKEKADIGFATDPDVDRLSIVSEKGKALGTELTLLLIENYILSQKKGNIATNLSSSRASEDIAAKYDVNVYRSRVGEINVAEKMKKHNCIIGGEGNGGIILPELHFTRDAPLGMALILSNLADSNKSISQLAMQIPKYYISKESLPINEYFDINKFSENIKKNFSESNFDYTDGIKVLNKDFWIHIRKSGTEPILRIIAETKSQSESARLIHTIKEIIK